MLLLIAITALLCCLTIQAGPRIEAFYPQGASEMSCAGSISWTKWFNEGKPSDNGNLDEEFLPTIQMAHSGDVCAGPLAMQIQSVGVLPIVASFSLSWTFVNNAIAGFKSGTLGVDFQVRFCCRNTNFTLTTTTTTTPRPLSNGTCGRAEIKNSFARIFGGSHAIPNSWPWVNRYKYSFSKEI
jgi:hypothetical protein